MCVCVFFFRKCNARVNISTIYPATLPSSTFFPLPYIVMSWIKDEQERGNVRYVSSNVMFVRQFYSHVVRAFFFRRESQKKRQQKSLGGVTYHVCVCVHEFLYPLFFFSYSYEMQTVYINSIVVCRLYIEHTRDGAAAAAHSRCDFNMRAATMTRRRRRRQRQRRVTYIFSDAGAQSVGFLYIYAIYERSAYIKNYMNSHMCCGALYTYKFAYRDHTHTQWQRTAPHTHDSTKY